MLYDLQQFLAYIDTNYFENLSLEFAANKMNFSESHFRKYLRNDQVFNYVIGVNLVRVEHAASQLKNTPDKVTDIAINCGFNNIRNFNRAFLNRFHWYGLTTFAAGTYSAVYSLSINRKHPISSL